MYANRFAFTLERILALAIWVALGAFALLTLWLGALGLMYPYQLDYGEGIVLWFARELAQGHSIYDRALMASSNYPPLAMLLPSMLFPILGDGYVAGRLLNFASALVVAFLIFKIVRESRLTPPLSKEAGGIAAIFFLGSTYIYHWVPLYRADLLGLGLAFAGIYFAWKNERQPRRRYILLFTLFFLLALYTKQTLVAAPAATFLSLFRRDKRTAILFALALGITGGAIYVAIDFVTRGGFTFGLVDSNATVFLPEQLFLLLRDFVFTHAVLLGLAAWEWMWRIRSGRFDVLDAYIVTILVTLSFAGRVGAWENYFFEMIAAVCVMAGMRIANSEWRMADSKALRFTFYVILFLQLALYIPNHDPRIALDMVAQDAPANRELAALLARTNGTIISEDMGALVTSGKDVAYYTFQFSSLASAGKWDQSWELNGLRDAKFPLVILERDTREDVDHYRRFTREFVSNLDRYYAKSLVIGKYEIYSPAPSLTLQSANFGDAIALVGWSAQSPTLQSGTWNLQIVWQAKKILPRRYKAFAHLLNEKGEKVTQEDKEPRNGAYPTTRWGVNEFVRENYVLSVPENLARGKYVLRVGWYDTDTGERLPVQGSTDDSSILTTFEAQ